MMKKRILTLFAPALLGVVSVPLQAAISTQLVIADGAGNSATLEWITTNVAGCPPAPSFCELTTGTVTTFGASGTEHGTFFFAGTIGNFTFDEETGEGQNSVSAPDLMNVSQINAKTIGAGGGSITSTFTDSQYSGLKPALNLSASNTFSAALGNGSTADFTAFGSAGNNVPAGTTIGDLATFTKTTGAGNGQSDALNKNFANPIGTTGSLTEVITLSFVGLGEIDSGFTIANGLLGTDVPEPTSVIFLGTMVVGLAGLIRKKQAKRV
jgi:hypothetical protein